ncbi:MAG: type II restriction endonuclease [Alphaproteobacteria bacterium]|nr:type II restriction endonuclease [Alphaproteobacteria bacterium]
MKNNPVFKRILNCGSDDEVFSYLIGSLKETIKSWDYFVNWNKVIHNYRDVERSLNLLNTLVGKEKIEEEALALLTDYPQIVGVIPALLAEREKKISLLVAPDNFNARQFDFSKPLPAKDGVLFLKESGFLKLLLNRNIKSVPDYFIGVEVGLDSNGRKNRSGTAMENLVEFFVKDICERNGYEYIAQATANKIKAKWNKEITVKKSSKRIDFAINTPHKLYLIETNFYGGGGSKLKSTAGEYADIYRQWTEDGHQFIWVTDGYGWKTTQRPLRDTFNTTDYIINIDMIQKGILEEVLKD